MTDIKEIADKADVIINGYALLKKEGGECAVVNLNRPGHTTVFKEDGSVIETSMDDIEITIARKYLKQGLKYVSEDSYAEVL